MMPQVAVMDAAQPSTSTTSTNTTASSTSSISSTPSTSSTSSSSVAPLSDNFSRFVQSHIRYLPDYPYRPRLRLLPPRTTTATTTSSASSSSASTTADDGQQQQQQQQQQLLPQPSLSVSPPVAPAPLPPPQNLRVLLIDPSEAVIAAMAFLVQSSKRIAFDIRVAEAHHTFQAALLHPLGEALRAHAVAHAIAGRITIYRSARHTSRAAADAHLIVLSTRVVDVTGAVGKSEAGYIAAVSTAKRTATKLPPDSDGGGGGRIGPGQGIRAKVLVLVEAERGELMFERNPCKCGGIEPPRPKLHRWASSCPRNGVIEWVPARLVDVYIAKEGVASREFIVRRAVIGLSQPPPPPV